MAWWMWILLGLGLLAAETITPGGFFVFFFGIAAILVGILAWMNTAGPDWAQWLLFSAFSVASLLLLRPRLVDRFNTGNRDGNTSLPEFVGDVAVLVDDLEPGAVGKAELRGTSWSVRSRHAVRMSRGLRCIVERVDGLTLWVVPPQEQGDR